MENLKTLMASSNSTLFAAIINVPKMIVPKGTKLIVGITLENRRIFVTMFAFLFESRDKALPYFMFFTVRLKVYMLIAAPVGGQASTKPIKIGYTGSV